METPVRLRRLEIQGFKSFATRTVFEFGPGITAIVGPNGSGKSNLADALRWVLGEQSPRVMRLRRLEDVIFAGGGQRAQSGVAEVSLVLGNNEGWLPVDFAEVIVTRRLHRSGESEYLLNRRRVRLRDITELFLKARLGQNSYAILGQGMVDTVLSLRPEDRRALIEEAADVRRHRLKIDEALTQLAATRENRDRVELLIAEIEPRLVQLERQARRAAQYAALSQELAEHLRRLFTGRARSARAAQERARARYAAAVEQAERAAEAAATAEQQVTALQQRLGSAQAAAQTLLERWSALNDRKLETERQVRSASERLPQLDRRRAELSQDLTALEAEAQELAAELPAGGSPAETLASAELAVREAESLAAGSRDAAARRQRELETAESALREERARRTRAQERAARLRDQLARLDGERARLEARSRTVLQKTRAWAQEFRQAHERAQEHEERVRAAREAQAGARRASEIATEGRREAGADAAEIEALAEQTQRRLALLVRQQEARRPAEEVAGALLDALRRGGPDQPQVLGMFGSLLHVQHGFEVAIEAALGESLNTLVLRTEAEALAAMRALQRIEAGRLTFFALDAAGAASVDLPAAGDLGVAAGYVRCEREYRPLVDLLLGRVVVVEDVEAGMAALGQWMTAAVTRDGTVLRRNGTLSGGRGKADGALFRLDAELGALREALARQEQQRAEANARFKAAREAADGAAANVRTAEQTLAVAERSRESAARAVADLQRRFAALRGELEWVRANRAEPAQRRAALKAELDGPAIGAPAATVGDALLAARLTAAREALAGARRDESDAAAALSQARGRLAALLAERTAIEALHRSRAEARERTTRTIALRAAAIEALTGERAQTGALVEQLTSELQERDAATRTALTALETARASVDALNGQEHALAAAVAAARTTAAGLDRGRLDAELALVRADEAAERVAQDLLNEGITLDDDALAGSGPEEPGPPLSAQESETRVRNLRRQIRDLGAVNEEAEADYRESKERHDFLKAQVADLEGAEAALLRAIEQLRGMVREQFRTTFEAVNADFQVYFRLFFGGGQARLALAEPEDYGESGVEIIAQPPGKRLQNLAMLSGGERSMTAVALLFALLESNPAPFCVLDEVDAALDEPNVGRFSDALARLARRSQFLVVTHNRGTVQAADQIYGVSMSGDGVSSVLSMRLSEAAPLLT